MGDAALRDQEEGSVLLPISQVETGLNQPRKYLTKRRWKSLPRPYGARILQPLTVRRLAFGVLSDYCGGTALARGQNGGLVTGAGHRGRSGRPKEYGTGLIENLQREDLNPWKKRRAIRCCLKNTD
jgi:hypothetical protein